MSSPATQSAMDDLIAAIGQVKDPILRRVLEHARYRVRKAYEAELAARRTLEDGRETVPAPPIVDTKLAQELAASLHVAELKRRTGT